MKSNREPASPAEAEGEDPLIKDMFIGVAQTVNDETNNTIAQQQ